MKLAHTSTASLRAILKTLVVLTTASMIPALQAGNLWDGGGGDDNWGTGANWSPDGSPGPGSGNDLFFGGSTRLTPFNNYAAFDDWRNITFNVGAGSFNLTGNAIDLFGKIENLSNNTQIFGLGSIALNSATNNEFNPVNGNLTITSANIFTNGNQLKVFGNNGFTLSFASGTNIQQTGSVSINQNSTVIYNSAHSYTGDTFVNAGKLQFNTGASASSSTIRLGDTSGSANAEMNLIAATGGQSLSNTIVARAGSSGVRTLDSQNTSGTNALTGVIALDAALTLKQSAGGTLNLTGSFMDVKQQTLTVNNAGTINISKSLDSSFAAGGSLVKQGTGTLILSDTSNNYTGTNNATLNANGTQIAGGILGIHGDASLGLAPAGAYNNIQFTASGTLQDTANNISLNANRNISIASGATAHLDSNGNTFTINGVVNGTGGLVNINGTGGTVVLTGNNTYTGATTVSQGTLQVNANNALGTNAAGTSVSSGAALRLNSVGYTTAEALSINGTGVASGGALVNSGISSYTGAVTVATNATINSGGGTLSLHGGIVKNGTTLTLAGGGRINVDTFGITGALANSDLIVDGTTLVTSVASTYNGPTSVINGGTFVAFNSNGSAIGTGNLTVDATSTLGGNHTALTGQVNPGVNNFIYLNGALVVGDPTAGVPTASTLTLATSGTGSTVLGAFSLLAFDLFTGAGAGDNTATTTAADYVRLFGTLDSTLGGQLILSNPNAMAGFAIGDQWKLFDLTAGPGSITTDLALDDSALGLGAGLVGNFNKSTGVYFISAVPEPSRVLFLGFGLIGWFFRRRR